jgi:hypothetical protein
MTYREAIQIQIKALQDIYDNSEALRDVASEFEKEAWNNLRRHLPSLWRPLQVMDNALSDPAAAYKLKGDYSLKVTADSI